MSSLIRALAKVIPGRMKFFGLVPWLAIEYLNQNKFMLAAFAHCAKCISLDGGAFPGFLPLSTIAAYAGAVTIQLSSFIFFGFM
jgi:hypothetical protein